MQPEGSWELDLSRFEERLVAKMLCVLSAQEPGDNWPEKQFQWSRDMDCMPGWELTTGKYHGNKGFTAASGQLNCDP